VRQSAAVDLELAVASEAEDAHRLHMRSRLGARRPMHAALGLVLALGGACSPSPGNKIPHPTGAAGGAAGVSGAAGAAGGAAGGGGMVGAAGATDAAGTGGGAAGASGGAAGAADAGLGGEGGTTDVGDASGAAGGDGAAGASDETEILAVAPTSGCGQDPGQILGTPVRYTMQTSGTKVATCADKKCGDWSYVREYFVTLPASYDKTKAYPITFEGPGCGGTGVNLFALDPNVSGAIIRVGLTPSADAQALHATNPGQGCFDDKEGDDSVDFVFYEKLYDQLAATLCFDRHRVFAGGNSSGATLGNELGCKYAGDPQRPVRAVISSAGLLPSDPKYTPTCTSHGMAGIWVYGTESGSDQPFVGSTVAIGRAIVVDKCDANAATDLTNAVDFPIGGGNASSTCKRLHGCSALFPLIVCPLPSAALGSSNASVSIPAFGTFTRLFEQPPLGP
jgi:hypothetical protein